MSRLTRVVVGLGAVVALLVTAGLSFAKAPSGRSVRVAVPRSADAIPVAWGVKSGVFAKAGFKVKVTYVASSRAAIAAVNNGNADLGVAGIVPLLVSTTTGGNLQMVAGSRVASAGMSAVVVRKGDVANAQGLAYKTVGVPEVNGFSQLATSAWISNADGDPSTATYAPFASAKAAAAVKSGKADGALVEWPYAAAAAKTAGLVSLGDAELTAYGRGATVSAWFTSGGTATAKAALVKSFVATLKAVLGSAALGKGARGAVSSAGVPAALAKTVALPAFSATLNRDSIDGIAFDLLAQGITTQQPDVDSLIWSGAPVK